MTLEVSNVQGGLRANAALFSFLRMLTFSSFHRSAPALLHVDTFLIFTLRNHFFFKGHTDECASNLS